jgi:hypothetical protein
MELTVSLFRTSVHNVVGPCLRYEVYYTKRISFGYNNSLIYLICTNSAHGQKLLSQDVQEI